MLKFHTLLLTVLSEGFMQTRLRTHVPMQGLSFTDVVRRIHNPMHAPSPWFRVQNASQFMLRGSYCAVSFDTAIRGPPPLMSCIEGGRLVMFTSRQGESRMLFTAPDQQPLLMLTLRAQQLLSGEACLSFDAAVLGAEPETSMWMACSLLLAIQGRGAMLLGDPPAAPDETCTEYRRHAMRMPF